MSVRPNYNVNSRNLLQKRGTKCCLIIFQNDDSKMMTESLQKFNIKIYSKKNAINF